MRRSARIGSSRPSRIQGARALFFTRCACGFCLAREPICAAELARRLALPRQRVNYHVRELERAGFLRPAGRQRKRNWIEQRYVATARSYVLSPEILGPLGARLAQHRGHGLRRLSAGPGRAGAGGPVEGRRGGTRPRASASRLSPSSPSFASRVRPSGPSSPMPSGRQSSGSSPDTPLPTARERTPGPRTPVPAGPGLLSRSAVDRSRGGPEKEVIMTERKHEGRRLRPEIRTTASPGRFGKPGRIPRRSRTGSSTAPRGKPEVGTIFTWIFEKFGYEIPYEVVAAEPEKRFALGGEIPGREPFLLEITIAREGARPSSPSSTPASWTGPVGTRNTRAWSPAGRTPSRF